MSSHSAASEATYPCAPSTIAGSLGSQATHPGGYSIGPIPIAETHNLSNLTPSSTSTPPPSTFDQTSAATSLVPSSVPGGHPTTRTTGSVTIKALIEEGIEDFERTHGKGKCSAHDFKLSMFQVNPLTNKGGYYVWLKFQLPEDTSKAEESVARATICEKKLTFFHDKHQSLLQNTNFQDCARQIGPSLHRSLPENSDTKFDPEKWKYQYDKDDWCLDCTVVRNKRNFAIKPCERSESNASLSRPVPSIDASATSETRAERP